MVDQFDPVRHGRDFTKFLARKDGGVYQRCTPLMPPERIVGNIEMLPVE